jgi:REP element-mobilizing transposase RayT
MRLDREQRAVVAAAFEEACARRGWTLRARAVQTAHVHVVVEADADASEVRGALKRAATRALRRRWPSLEGRELWAGSGWTTTLGAFRDVDRSIDYAEHDHHRPRR